MLPQHRKLSLDVRRTIENNDISGIRPHQTYQSFVTAAGGHNELGFIEKDVRNYITREVRNVTDEEDAKEFGKYFLRKRTKTSFMRLYLMSNRRDRPIIEFDPEIEKTLTRNRNKVKAQRALFRERQEANSDEGALMVDVESSTN
ncbi:hypothetical protein PIB30_102057 [Stylosanthes scabra]|uniref:Uncharacterized protein n=1 Tax=Stylosanthes scabra TaxID=79078 RepID=A0ABU6VXF2_9FABA|nr:hypothetical protein [Stylosanthes scabra]